MSTQQNERHAIEELESSGTTGMLPPFRIGEDPVIHLVRTTVVKELHLLGVSRGVSSVVARPGMNVLVFGVGHGSPGNHPDFALGYGEGKIDWEQEGIIAHYAVLLLLRRASIEEVARMGVDDSCVQACRCIERLEFKQYLAVRGKRPVFEFYRTGKTAAFVALY